jgi:hypothetical protein
VQGNEKRRSGPQELEVSKKTVVAVLIDANGPGFLDEDTHELLAQWNVFPLFSPPRTPAYNGTKSKPATGRGLRNENGAQMLCNEIE